MDVDTARNQRDTVSVGLEGGGMRTELRLVDEPDAVPRARRFATATATALGVRDLAADAEVVVAELVTNALLHGAPPVVVRLLRVGEHVRVEVSDATRRPPAPGASAADAMTGRGLVLVRAVCRRWGVEPTAEGKVVWCELAARSDAQGSDAHSADEPVDVDALPAVWGEDEPAEERFPVRLGDVPTDLLLAEKVHVDNLVRELTLAAGGAAAAHTVVPPHVAELIGSVVRFAGARRAIKAQALAAAERGDPRTELTLLLPVRAADAGEEYVAALDEADRYAHAARLLTLETPPQQRVFRRWYVESLVAQLRAAARGEPTPSAQTFEQRLLDEFGIVTAAQRASDRAARLQQVTAALAATTTVEQVAKVVVGEGVAALGASGGGLLLSTPDDRLTVPAALGYAEQLIEWLQAEHRDVELPAAAAMRTGEPVWLESRQARDERFPGLVGLEPGTVAVCAVPLTMAGQVLGALRFSFGSPRLFDHDERRFVLALATQTAQAVERSLLYTSEREASAAAEQARSAAEALAARLGQLQQVTAELAGADDVDEVAEIVVTHAADALAAELASVCLLTSEQDQLQIVRSRGIRAELVERWQSFPVDAELPASEAVRTGKPVVVASRDELERRYPLLAGQARKDRSLLCLPLIVRARVIGVISLSFPADRIVDAEELRFAGSLATTCAQAVDRARALRTAAAMSDRMTFLAQASAVLAETLDYRATLASIARLVVPRLADWCAVQVREGGLLQTVAVEHVDPAKVAFARDLQRRYPPNPDAETGATNVIRTGVSEFFEITDEMLVAATVDAEHLRLARELQLTSALVVPLIGRSGPFGAISMFYDAASGRRYDLDDLAFAEDIARRAALAADNARQFYLQTGRLAAVQRVAEAAQHAILPPVPARAGPLALAAAYVSAAEEALVGGDLYEVAQRDDSVRLLIGDVRGKGLEAVRLATVVLGEFRAAAADHDGLVEVARQMDTRVADYLAEEDFVTALLAEIRPDGRCTFVCCGHPPPMLAHTGVVTKITCRATVPLGLGVEPTATTATLAPGDRLLLYTDGLIEARDRAGTFADTAQVVAPLADGPLDGVLDRVLSALHEAIGGNLGDDLALLAAEYRPE